MIKIYTNYYQFKLEKKKGKVMKLLETVINLFYNCLKYGSQRVSTFIRVILSTLKTYLISPLKSLFHKPNKNFKDYSKMGNHNLKDNGDENSSINYGGKVKLQLSDSLSEKNYEILSITKSLDPISGCENSTNIQSEYSIEENPIVPGLFPSFTPSHSNNKASMVESNKKHNQNVKKSSIDTDEISKKMLNLIDFYYNDTQKLSISSNTTTNNNNSNNNIHSNHDCDSNLLTDYESVYLNLDDGGNYEYTENYDDINNFQSSPLSSLSPHSLDDTLEYQANDHDHDNYLNNSNTYNMTHSPATYTCNSKTYNRFNNNNDTSDLFPCIDYSQFDRSSPNYISLTPSGKS